MSDPILVLNAGSSSLKFCVLAAAGGAIEAQLGGRVEGLHVTPRFVVKDAGGRTLAERGWDSSHGLDHDGALAFVLDWLDAHAAIGQRLGAVGHRVVHGGTEFGSAVRLHAAIVRYVEQTRADLAEEELGPRRDSAPPPPSQAPPAGLRCPGAHGSLGGR